MDLYIEVHGLEEALSRLDRVSAGAKAQLRQAMQMAVRDIQEEARSKHRFVTRTGEAERSITTAVESGRDTLVGTVGTTRKVTVYLHQGTQGHVIRPKRKLALRWTAGGQFVFAKRAYHPGTRRDPFIFDAARSQERRVVGRFERAIQRVMEEVR
ncbi:MULTISPECIES: HK97 gp10 family phage protein [Megasphaera]|uniref:Tail protein, HK97 family n=1 Tax=Megasphaera vaginalis (ex Srinivasan et al. 2021) TaxID=1111454 RepID=U7UGG7_9FIRM|nr:MULTISPECIES: HK97 gp10 family phage protein [Megasphaera]ERT58406.1 tail protein, HK97 family [Megasphaera vaginalis (ex Srinivasan et al. 2021)]